MKDYFSLMRNAITCLFLLLMIPLAGTAQRINWSNRAATIYKAIQKNLYDSSASLYLESQPHAADTKYAHLWGVCALFQAANELELATKKQQLVSSLVPLVLRYENRKQPLPGLQAKPASVAADDRYYDDNQWIGITAIDAYRRTGNNRYLQLAEKIYRFMMTGWDTISGGGIYWKEGDHSTKNTCSNGPGAVLSLKLYRATKNETYFKTGLALYNWAQLKLQAPSGVYYDNLQLPAGTVDKRTYTYNSGTMLESAVLLYQITGNKQYKEEAQRVAAASLDHFYKEGRFPKHYWFNAVLLRGYEALAQADGNKKYLQAFERYAELEWPLFENRPADSKMELLQWAGYLEICSRLAQMQTRK